MTSLFGSLEVGCTTPAQMRMAAADAVKLGDKTRIEEALGEPESVLALERSARGCRERWTYTECRTDGPQVIFVDFDPTGQVCDYSVAAFASERNEP